MSNYPPGVTGNEDAFGPRAEFETEAGIDYACEECDAPAPETVLRSVWSSGVDDSWECEKCSHLNVRDVFEDEPELDADWGDEPW